MTHSIIELTRKFRKDYIASKLTVEQVIRLLVLEEHIVLPFYVLNILKTRVIEDFEFDTLPFEIETIDRHELDECGVDDYDFLKGLDFTAYRVGLPSVLKYYVAYEDKLLEQTLNVEREMDWELTTMLDTLAYRVKKETT